MYNDHRTPTGKGYPQGGGSRQGGMDRQGYTAKEKPKLTRQNYVDEAERVIKTLERDRSEKMKLTTSKIRNLLAMAATLKTDAQHSREDKLSCDLQSRVQYLKMRIAYEAGRESTVQDFEKKAHLLDHVSEIGDDRKKLMVFCEYMEALTAYHRYYGGRDN